MAADSVYSQIADSNAVDIGAGLSDEARKLLLVSSAPGARNDGGGGGGGPALLEVKAVLDPLTTAAQRVAPLLVFLRDVLGARVELLLLPEPQISEFPLPNFYRHVSPSSTVAGAATVAAAELAPRFFTATQCTPSTNQTRGTLAPRPRTCSPLPAKRERERERETEIEHDSRPFSTSLLLAAQSSASGGGSCV